MLSISCVYLGQTYWLLFVMSYYDFVTFPCGLLGQLWYWILLIPGLYRLSYLFASLIIGLNIFISNQFIQCNTIFNHTNIRIRAEAKAYQVFLLYNILTKFRGNDFSFA